MSAPNSRQLVAGMVGGGSGADIGKTHRYAMRLDGHFDLRAGIFGRDPKNSSTIAVGLGVPAERNYRDSHEMAEAEAAREDGVDVVVVATPNDSHFQIARTFLEHGISVVCEKPLTQDSTTAAELVRIAGANDAILAVPHCYSAYAMVRQAARMVRNGELGAIRFVDVEHASGWAATALEKEGHKQAKWRTNPDIAGFPSVVGDLGTHAFHLLRYITGLEAERLSGRLQTFVPGRRVFDNATVELELSGNVPARVWASMAATGHNHGLRIRVYGERGSLEWQHEDPHHLKVQDLAGATTILTHGLSTLHDDASRLTRVGLGHPEGFLEAFANFYSDLAEVLRARRDSTPIPERELSFPTGIDGLIGVQFVEAVAASHQDDSAWKTPVSAYRKATA
ncbi:Gfo/Idh/MocA family protein [Paenarthrobacter nitroguajacolicus]|uniref:Gfo/Idh/MocA family protein n=1 Tax=Paenarthrobacter nitroguajacolicus TaxID=211146 RepID=UPI00248C0AF2|nr:Gfo/Idh/MocA family oxidoreductase [Paenarthrobacter nitroguajacolicus]MDI2034321.1 Inositol 2-dehydrogenase/D-chiro-inositol 3-dehydrogenase [Paenarthrobacter nitroguajacolicus]